METSKCLEEYGFAKVKGFAFWLAKLNGEFKGKIWVTFLGTDQYACVTKNDKHWLLLSASSLEKFVTAKNLKKKYYLKAVCQMTEVIKVFVNIKYKSENSSKQH